MEQPYRILLIKSNAEAAARAAAYLRDQGTWVTVAADGERGLSACASEHFDLAVIDTALPAMDGLSVLKELRAKGEEPPVILITPKDDDAAGIAGLELGADCYVQRPYTLRDLSARIKAMLRRATVVSQRDKEPPVLKTGSLEVARSTRSVSLNGQPVTLTPKEFDLLWYFASHPGRVFTRAQLLDAVWVYGHDGYEHTVNSHINRLRGEDRARPRSPQPHPYGMGRGLQVLRRRAPPGNALTGSP